MATKRISQREAKRLKLQVAAFRLLLESERSVYLQEYRGVHIATIHDTEVSALVRVARRLGHKVVVVGDETSQLRLMALPHPKERD